MENLTVIVPSNNRTFFLRRSATYCNNYNLAVIIKDRSNDTQKKGWMEILIKIFNIFMKNILPATVKSGKKINKNKVYNLIV